MKTKAWISYRADYLNMFADIKKADQDSILAAFYPCIYIISRRDCGQN